MANKAFLSIGDETFSSGWFIELELLMPFRPEDFDGESQFSTTVKKALENLSRYGITTEKIRKKIKKRL